MNERLVILMVTLLLSGCASMPEPVAGTKEASLPSPRACKAQGLVFVRDANGKSFCVTEAQAKCHSSALLVLGDSECLNTLMWKDERARPDPLPQGTTATPPKRD